MTACHTNRVCRISFTLQAVPFWIVERSNEIAEREKTGANERRGARPRGPRGSHSGAGAAPE